MKWLWGVVVLAVLQVISSLMSLLISAELSIAAWLFAGLLIFGLSPMKLLVGERKVLADLLAAIAFLLLSIDTLMGAVLQMFAGNIRVLGMFMIYGTTVRAVSLSIALLLLIVVAFIAGRLAFRKPCMLVMMNRLHSVAAFFLLLGVYVCVFQLVIALLTYAAVVFLCGVFLLFALIRLGIVQRNVFSSFLELFMHRRTFLLGVSGLLVAKFLADIGSQLLPEMFTDMPGLLAHALFPAMPGGAVLAISYLLGLVGMLVLLLLPIVIWFRIFMIRTGQAKHPDWGRLTTALLLGLGVLYFLAPPYAYSEHGFGVNAVSAQVTIIALLVGAIVFALCAVFGFANRTRRLFMLGPMLLALLFLGIYVYSAFSSSFIAYAHEIMGTTLETALLLPLFVTLCCVTLFFYVSGYCSFLYEMWRD